MVVHQLNQTEDRSKVNRRSSPRQRNAGSTNLSVGRVHQPEACGAACALPAAEASLAACRGPWRLMAEASQLCARALPRHSSPTTRRRSQRVLRPIWLIRLLYTAPAVAEHGPSDETFAGLERMEECVGSSRNGASICLSHDVVLPSGKPSATSWYELARSSSAAASVQLHMSVASMVGGSHSGTASSSSGLVQVSLLPAGTQRIRRVTLRLRGAGLSDSLTLTGRTEWHAILPTNQGPRGTATGPVVNKDRPATLTDDVYAAIPRQLRRSAIGEEGSDRREIISEAVHASINPTTLPIMAHLPPPRAVAHPLHGKFTAHAHLYDLLSPAGLYALAKGVPMRLHGKLGECTLSRFYVAGTTHDPDLSSETFCPHVDAQARLEALEQLDCRGEGSTICWEARAAYERFLGPPPTSEASAAAASASSAVPAASGDSSASLAIARCLVGNRCFDSLVNHVRDELRRHERRGPAEKRYANSVRRRMGSTSDALAPVATARPLWCPTAGCAETYSHLCCHACSAAPAGSFFMLDIALSLCACIHLHTCAERPIG